MDFEGIPCMATLTPLYVSDSVISSSPLRLQVGKDHHVAHSSNIKVDKASKSAIITSIDSNGISTSVSYANGSIINIGSSKFKFTLDSADKENLSLQDGSLLSPKSPRASRAASSSSALSPLRSPPASSSSKFLGASASRRSLGSVLKRKTMGDSLVPSASMSYSSKKRVSIAPATLGSADYSPSSSSPSASAEVAPSTSAAAASHSPKTPIAALDFESSQTPASVSRNSAMRKRMSVGTLSESRRRSSAAFMLPSDGPSFSSASPYSATKSSFSSLLQVEKLNSAMAASARSYDVLKIALIAEKEHTAALCQQIKLLEHMAKLSGKSARRIRRYDQNRGYEIRSKYAAQIAALKQELEAERVAFDEKEQEMIENAERREQELMTISEEQRLAYEEREQAAKEAMESLSKSFEEKESKYSQMILDKEEEMKAMMEEHSVAKMRELEAVNSAAGQREQELTQQMAAQKQSFEQKELELNQRIQNLEQESKAQQIQFEKQLQALKQESASQLAAMEADSENAIAILQSKHAEQVSSLGSQHEEKIGSLNAVISSSQSEVSSLQVQLQQLEERRAQEAAVAAQQIATANAEIASLQSSVVHLTDRVDFYRSRSRAISLKLIDLQGSIRVLCRLRPVSSSETVISQLTDEQVSVVENAASLVPGAPMAALSAKQRPRSFEMDRVFPMEATQSDIFEEVAPVMGSLLEGINVCVFAYGQTGSGKTQTMFGDPLDLVQRGVIPRSVDELFSRMNEEEMKSKWEFSIQVQMIEVYQERCYDLLSFSPDSSVIDFSSSLENGEMKVDIRSTRVEAVQVSDVLDVIVRGSENRQQRKTNMNDRSSRSHSIVRISIEGRSKHGTAERLSSRLCLVDLAGSECIGMSGATGEAAAEAGAINKSLCALGSVLQALHKQNSHVPYRDSKLTQVLSDVLHGQSKVVTFLTCWPRKDNLSQTLASLSFGSTARSVCRGPVKKNRTLATSAASGAASSSSSIPSASSSSLMSSKSKLKE